MAKGESAGTQAREGAGSHVEFAKDPERAALVGDRPQHLEQGLRIVGCLVHQILRGGANVDRSGMIFLFPHLIHYANHPLCMESDED